jgi:hypothetical protein
MMEDFQNNSLVEGDEKYSSSNEIQEAAMTMDYRDGPPSIPGQIMWDLW